MIDYGRLGYEIFREYCDGYSLGSGQEMCPYEELSEGIKGFWSEAADIVLAKEAIDK